MKILFCCDPGDSRAVDEAYEREAQAATDLGIEYHLFDYEALVNEGDPSRAVRRVPVQPEATACAYRGWMLRPPQYRLFCEALAGKGIRLINDPAAYQHCHYLPESYSVIEGLTPRSVWMRATSEVSMDAIMELLRPFGSEPVIVKDFVKSRKHEWDEACFIPSASDRSGVERVVRRFVQLQDEDLSEGLVFREFVLFQPLAQHSKSGMPLTLEYRLFFLYGRLVYWTHYWDEGDYGDYRPPVERFQDVAARIRSRFFTMDVARRTDGEWMIVELGDGQVAGLPDKADVRSFFSALRNASGLPAHEGWDGAAGRSYSG